MQPEGCDQCLNVQVEAGDGWCPSWLCLALVLFNILTAPSASLHVAPRWVVQLTYLEERMPARGKFSKSGCYRLVYTWVRATLDIGTDQENSLKEALWTSGVSCG